MPPAKPNPLLSVVRIVPLGEITAYSVQEHELDALARGSSGSHLLSLSYALIPFSAAFVIAIFGTEIPDIRVYNAFVMVALTTGLAGIICLILGILSHRSNKWLVDEIKKRKGPPTPPSQP